MTAPPLVRPGVRFMLQHPAHVIALGFGAGLSPAAPGTVGTLAALPFGLLLLQRFPGWSYLAICATLALVGVWACDVTGRHLRVPDHGSIVWDEVVAFLLVLFFVPGSPIGQAFAFLLFRLFDIVKVPPARYIDRHWKNGAGVMIDDFVAAFYTVLVLAVATRVLG